MKKVIALMIMVGMFLGPMGSVGTALAADRTAVAHASASALIPGLGQLLNNEQATWPGRLKLATMFGLELGAILATPALARSGFPEVMIGVAMLAVNHVWSATDAYRNALQQPEVRLTGPRTR